jgi:hypothetical protein
MRNDAAEKGKEMTLVRECEGAMETGMERENGKHSDL